MKVRKSISIDATVAGFVDRWGSARQLNFSAAIEAIVRKFLEMDDLTWQKEIEHRIAKRVEKLLRET